MVLLIPRASVILLSILPLVAEAEPRRWSGVDSAAKVEIGHETTEVKVSDRKSFPPVALPDDVKIGDLAVPSRVIDRLAREQVHTVGDLRSLYEREGHNNFARLAEFDRHCVLSVWGILKETPTVLIRPEGLLANDVQIVHLNVSKRLRDGLLNKTLTTVGQVRELYATEDDDYFLHIGNFGRTSLAEMKSMLGQSEVQRVLGQNFGVGLGYHVLVQRLDLDKHLKKALVADQLKTIGDLRAVLSAHEDRHLLRILNVDATELAALKAAVGPVNVRPPAAPPRLAVRFGLAALLSGDQYWPQFGLSARAVSVLEANGMRKLSDLRERYADRGEELFRTIFSGEPETLEDIAAKLGFTNPLGTAGDCTREMTAL